MKSFRVQFLPDGIVVEGQGRDNLVTLAAQAGITLRGACGGAGHCGLCRVLLRTGRVAVGANGEQIADGPLPVLACQVRPLSDLTVEIPDEARLGEHRVVFEEPSFGAAPEGTVGQTWALSPLYRVVDVDLPTLRTDAGVTDLTRLFKGLQAIKPGPAPRVGLDVLRRLPGVLQHGGERVTVELAVTGDGVEMVDVYPAAERGCPLGLALDLGTTTLAGQVVDLETGRVLAERGTYNRQAAFGDDVISRIICADEGGLDRLQEKTAESINTLLRVLLDGSGRSPRDIRTVVCAGNPTMVHLFLGVDPSRLRLEPYTPVANHWPPVRSAELGLDVHPGALTHVMPGVASYIGGDITAGLVASGMDIAEEVTLFVDIGTNGEMVMGNRDWLVGCACSAGPAFEGGGVRCGMRAEAGAVEKLQVTGTGDEVLSRTIGGAAPAGVCGSGLIAILSTLRSAGVLDRAGRFNLNAKNPRLRTGSQGPEFVLFWPAETAHGRAIVISEAEIGHLLRAKAAVFAAVRVMLQNIGVGLDEIKRVVIAGGFGRFLELDEVVAIGLLPDLPRERYSYLGNAALKGSRAAILSAEARERITAVSRRITYLSLDDDPAFMDEFMQAMFLPHTDESLFPSVVGESGA